jgi:hypothetical protein
VEINALHPFGAGKELSLNVQFHDVGVATVRQLCAASGDGLNKEGKSGLERLRQASRD